MQSEDGVKALIFLGRIGAPFGLAGFVKVHSFTQPIESILEYATWDLLKQNQWTEVTVVEGRKHTDCLVAKFKGIDDKDAANALCHSKIAVSREALPAVPQDVFYWADLQDLSVYTQSGEAVGKVQYLYENAGTDILVVKHQDKERHIPFLMHDTILNVDLKAKKIIIDWDLAL